jgi:hypothetical protein
MVPAQHFFTMEACFHIFLSVGTYVLMSFAPNSDGELRIANCNAIALIT